MKQREAKKPKCPHCGEEFAKLVDGKIPTHDFPRPCRAVCRGSGQEPKAHNDTPLWKDDPLQEGRDWLERARMELLVYGFAIVKQMAEFNGQQSGTMQCPLCLKQVKFSIAPNNGHCAARCETPLCINAME